MMFDGSTADGGPATGFAKNSQYSKLDNSTTFDLRNGGGNAAMGGAATAKNTIVSQKDYYMNATQTSTQRTLTVRLHDYINKLLNPSR